MGREIRVEKCGFSQDKHFPTGGPRRDDGAPRGVDKEEEVCHSRGADTYNNIGSGTCTPSPTRQKGGKGVGAGVNDWR
ncbi:MAG: hypothetical protein PUJ30_04090 [Bacteroidales bacterium]|nr:hypothetical protein [Bacteroidales bacterium]MDY4620186.1 hypothetical protein [Alloprevotella sp.]